MNERDATNVTKTLCLAIESEEIVNAIAWFEL
ncbi:hypothetical protein Poly59_32420 [Rubripirellula reticaptiva]|uniref:Uncharacterized protein n=1 Tax=Rubripirellula reticaptiva TaxID=2528013 RepID=A0A5C6ERR5_9BACT|nr:hypothetical protein Poly59_32420 [Rubripirellula reticaptiva]